MYLVHVINPANADAVTTSAVCFVLCLLALYVSLVVSIMACNVPKQVAKVTTLAPNIISK